MKEYKTYKGKKLVPYYDGRNLKVKFEGGGQVPPELTGEFTSERELEIAIIKYLSKKYPKHAQGSLKVEIGDDLDREVD